MLSIIMNSWQVLITNYEYQHTSLSFFFPPLEAKKTIS